MRKTNYCIRNICYVGVNETKRSTITYTPQGFIDGIKAAKGRTCYFSISPTEDASYYV